MSTKVTIDNRNRIINGNRKLEWVPVARMRISDRAQRRHTSAASRAKIERIAREFDPDLFGHPLTSYRDGHFYIVDGAHRYLALVEIGYADQLVQCWVYRNMDEAEEAAKFLQHNDIRPVGPMDKFKVGLVAGWPDEVEIDRIVRANGMSIGSSPAQIGCITAVRAVYDNGGTPVLDQTIRIIRDAYGDNGFEAGIVGGVGLFCRHYESVFTESRIVDRLSRKRGGVNGLRQDALSLKERYALSNAESVCGALVEVYNHNLRTGRLNGWLSTLKGDAASA